jgi:hypothetical protein
MQHCSPSPGNNGHPEASFAPYQISSLARFFCRGLLQHSALYKYAWAQEQHHQEHRLHLMVSATLHGALVRPGLCECRLAAETCLSLREIAADCFILV